MNMTCQESDSKLLETAVPWLMYVFMIQLYDKNNEDDGNDLLLPVFV